MAWLLSVFGYPLGDFLGCLLKLGEKFFGTNISKSHINLLFRYFIAPAALAEGICNVLQQSLGFGGFCEVGQSFQDCDQGCLVLLTLKIRSGKPPL